MSIVNVGLPQTGTGDTLYDAFTKVNAEFERLDLAIDGLANEGFNAFRNPYTIFVATDGDDTANGHSYGEPVRSIRQAVQLANAIKASEAEARVLISVAPGAYTESNLPIRVARDVIIKGDKLRAVLIKPAVGEELKGFFKVDSGFMMWGITFLGHQADSTQTGWVVSFDELADNTALGADSLGAYITASPYFQNCSSITAEDDSGAAPSVSQGDTGGGILVDGNACASNSPLRSIVVDSFTQVNLGGIGCKVINDGYAQLVSFFGTFCEYHVLCQTGGQVNFTSGTTDFGKYGLVADGYSSEPMYTALATRVHYGASRIQKNFTINTSTNVFTCTAHGLTLNDQITFKALDGSLPAPLVQGTTYYARTITTDTFQISTTSGGSALDITGSLVGDETFEFTRQGELYIDADNFTANRIGSDSRPGQGSLLFARLVFPRTGSLAADANTPGTVNSVYEDNGVFYADAVLDTAPAEVGKHEYVKNSGTVVVTRVGTFVDAQGNAIPTTPVAGLNTYTFIVTSVDYNHLTGLTRFGAFNYIPNANDSFYFVNTEYICQQSAMVITSAAPINQFGQVIPENDNTQVGYRIFVYNALNGGLRYPLADNQKLDFRRRSQISAPAHVFEYVGSGTNYDALPENGGVPIQANSYQELNNGRVFISWTNEKGDFGVGNRFLVDGTTGAVTIDASSLSLSGLSAIGPFSRNGGLSTVGVQALEISDNINMVSSLGITDINTIPTQTAIVGYVTGFFNGESNITSLRINDVMFYSVQSEAFYPTTRPQLAPLEPGDMLWDASLRTWLGWTGTRFANELDVRVLNNGSKSYNFYQTTKPTYRNVGEPTQSALQSGDRWEKPGSHIAYYNGSVWADVVSSRVYLVGTLTATTAFTTILSGTRLSFGYLDTTTGFYYFIIDNNIVVSTNFGASFQTLFSTNLQALAGNNTPQSFLRHSSGSYVVSISNLVCYSSDGTTFATKTLTAVPPHYFAEVSNGDIYAFPAFTSLAVSRSSDGGNTWVASGSMPVQGAKGATRVSTNQIAVLTLSSLYILNTTTGVYTASNLPIASFTAVAGLHFNNGVLYLSGYGAGTDGDRVWRSTDLGATWVDTGLRVPLTFVDNLGAVVTRSYTGSSSAKNNGVISTHPSSPQIIGGKQLVDTITIEYNVVAGQTPNHNASNYMQLAINYLNYATNVTTQYTVVLNDPYPSATTALINIPINAVANNSTHIQYSWAAVTGTPVPVSVSVTFTSRRVYDS